MKRRFLCLCLAVSMILTGCSWFSGSYISIKPHHEQNPGTHSDSLSASDYSQLRGLLAELTEAGTENAVINISEYNQDELEEGMANAIRYITTILPIGAYAIDKVTYEIGSNSGQPAISVNISYLHGRAELRRIRHVKDMMDAKDLITAALDDCADSVVLYVENYSEMDLIQLAADYALQQPNLVMEIPVVAVGIYPEQGLRRILEVKFTYQTSRDTLRNMQNQVQRVFTSASLYVNHNDAESQKYAQLFSFLTERFEYKIETSITPSYSLLCHGVGDSKAFASAYAAMCRRVGLDCRMISGTKDGAAWYWNLLCIEDSYFHVDLLESRDAGQLIYRTDEEMSGYVWDYSTYPATDILIPVTEDAEPVAEVMHPGTEATEPVPEATEPTPEATEPVPEATEPTPEATESVPETPEPVPEATEPIPEATESIVEETEPVTETAE